MVIKTCLDNCCSLLIEPFIHPSYKKFHHLNNKPRKKSGIFLYDKNQKKILLVQSRGNLWGLPKGSHKGYETCQECAVREVKEETGLDIDMSILTQFYKIRSNTCYYYVEMEETPVSVQKMLVNEINDANGIGWINVDCLKKLVDKKLIKLNQHFIRTVKFFLNLDF